ncbi:hypothetical protein FA95DRAFT_1359269 [Auriscalpium vulgare]|uniref:Uncharacterized protein n=1 Tax=Auriscalpium vulgare TaxID=40419 RepID=A0ACB8RRD1_9AGAM|nr:hypothetical protein FA95DRAFT_1359269 [Auriscalpium vulgare]
MSRKAKWDVFCFVLQPQAWQAPLSRELLVFNGFVRMLTRTLRTLLETTTLNMLLRGDARKARDDLLDIALSLPFQGEVNTGFGVLAKVYLDALTHLNGQQRVHDPNAEGVREAKAMALEICEETFPGVKSPRLEVERGFRFWDVVRVCAAGCAACGADGGGAAGVDCDPGGARVGAGCGGTGVAVRGGGSVAGADAAVSGRAGRAGGLGRLFGLVCCAGLCANRAAINESICADRGGDLVWED